MSWLYRSQCGFFVFLDNFYCYVSRCRLSHDQCLHLWFEDPHLTFTSSSLAPDL